MYLHVYKFTTVCHSLRCNNTPCLGFITPLRNGNAHQELGKLISAKDRIAAYLGKCRAKMKKLAPRTGDSCQSLYLNWLPCITAKKRWILRHLVEMWNLLACTARWPLPEEQPAVKVPNTNKSSPRTGPWKDSIPMPPACVIVVLSRISMPCRQKCWYVWCFCATNDRQWIKQLPPPSVPRILIMERLLTPNLGWKQSCQGWRTLQAKFVKFQKLVTDTYEWQI